MNYDEVVEVENPFTYCKICTGPIANGCMAHRYEDGWVHRFKSTCDWHKEYYASFDAHFADEVGLRMD